MLKTGFGKTKLRIEQKDLPIREFKAKLTDLYTRVAYFSDGDRKLLILSLDMTSLTDRDIAIFKEWISKKFGLVQDQIWVSVTHTFASPHLKHDIHELTDKDEYERFLKILKNSILSATEQAVNSPESTKVWIGKVTCPLNVNRNLETTQGWWLGRNLKEYSNHDLYVISFKQKNGHQNMIFNYDIQPSVFDHITNDEDERIITGDIFGVAATIIENQDYDVALPLIGAAGDQRPLLMADNNNKFEVNKNILFEEGRILAEAIQAATKSSREIVCNEVKKFEIRLRLSSQKQQLKTFDIVPTKKYYFIQTDQGVEVSLVALDLGDLVIVGTQPELNSSFAQKCRQTIKKPYVLITTLMNGARKYLPEKKDFERITYESMNSPIGIDADEQMIHGFRKLNNLLKGEN